MQALTQGKSQVKLVSFDSSAALIDVLKAGAIDSLADPGSVRAGYDR